jgi:preprotein translocase subunit SecE
VSLASKIVWPLRQSTSKLYFWKRYFLDIKQRSVVTQYYSVRRSLLKYSSTAGKRFYSSGGQRNTLAQVLMYNSVRRSLSVKYNSARASAFTLLVDKGIRWLMYWCTIQWDAVYWNIDLRHLPRASAFTLLVDKGIPEYVGSSIDVWFSETQSIQV